MRDCDNCARLGTENCRIRQGYAIGSNEVESCPHLYPARFARLCSDCTPHNQRICRSVFGKLWSDKSWGGVGCRHPIDDYVNRWHPLTVPPPPAEE